jgi:hypothetical protein
MGSSLYDRFGEGFTLLRLNSSIDTGPIAQAATRRNIPLTVLDLTVPEARELYERDLVLIRPDQFIAWRGNHIPDDPDAMLATVTGY